jgi:predicted metal-dependent peptidase
MDILGSIARMGRNLMWRQPFYGLFLSSMNKVTSDKIPTAGVSKNGITVQLTVGEKFWEEIPDNVKEGVLHHELLHVALDHLNLRDKYPDKELFNIAADISINQMIEDKYKSEHFLNYDSFKNIPLKQNEDTDYYYTTLNQNRKDPQLQGMLEALKDANFKNMANHQSWKEFEKLSEAEKKLIRKTVEGQLKECAENIKNRGTIPGELSSILDGILNPELPKFNWKAYLRRFAGGSNKIYTKKLRRKFSKRFNDNPGLKIKQKKHVLVAIDTSGSVSDEELIEFMNEIHHIWRTGTKVTIVQCDASMHAPESFEGLKKWGGKIHGRGGTDFTQPCDYFNKHKNQYCSLIYLTDGEGGTAVKPLKKTLWVHSSKSSINDELPGFKIKLN